MKEFLKQICAINEIKANLDEVKIICKQILIDHTLEIDGCRYYVRSGDLDCRTTCQWYPSYHIVKIVRAVVKNVSKLKSEKKEEEKKNIVIEGVTLSDTEILYEAIVEQLKKKFYAKQRKV